MKILVQRVLEASVTVDDKVVSQIKEGLLVFVGVGNDDTEEDAIWLANKCATLRIFEDNAGKMNLSVLDVKASVLAVSQFTLYGDCQKSRRPSFTSAASPEKGRALYEVFCGALRKEVSVETGIFGAEMKVALVNDGPATFILERGGR